MVRNRLSVRSVLFTAAVLGGLFSSYGQTPAVTNEPGVSVKTDRTNALYACGEPATFIISRNGSGNPASTNDPVAVTLVFTLDGGKTIAEKKIEIRDQSTESRTLEQPGFLRCDVTWKKNGKTVSACAAAGFDPERIKTETTMPADFDAFWSNGVSRMAQVPLDLKIDEIPSFSDTTVRCQKISIQAIDGTRLYAFLGIPADRKPPFPLIVLLPGAGYGPRSPEWVRDWARKGAVALNIGIHAFDLEMPTREVEATYARYKNPKTYGGVTNREAYLFYRSILGVDRMIKYGMSRPDVDPKRVVVNGSSQGGGLTLIMAALNPSIAGCAANVPALCDHGAYRLDRSPGWPFFVPVDDPARDAYLACSRYYDAVNFAREVKCPALVSVGFIDGTCHPSSVLAAYNEIGSTKRLFTGPLQGHDAIRAYSDFSGGWMMEKLGLTANISPASVGKVAQADWDAYCQWMASLPADQLAWEKMLQKHLGDYYFPLYLKQRLAGGYTLAEPDDWGFVQDDPALPRVLLIGDSISHMYTAAVRKRLKGKANVHRAPANCESTREGLANLDDWTACPPGKKWDLIHFAFGYHDRNRSAEAYAGNLEKLIARLQKTGAILVWARTAPFINTADAGALCAKLNAAADAVMAKHPEIRIDDLYAAVADNPEKYICGDKIHYNEDGVALQSAAVAKAITEALKDSAAR